MKGKWQRIGQQHYFNINFKMLYWSGLFLFALFGITNAADLKSGKFTTLYIEKIHASCFCSISTLIVVFYYKEVQDSLYDYTERFICIILMSFCIRFMKVSQTFH